MKTFKELYNLIELEIKDNIKSKKKLLDLEDELLKEIYFEDHSDDVSKIRNSILVTKTNILSNQLKVNLLLAEAVAIRPKVPDINKFWIKCVKRRVSIK